MAGRIRTIKPELLEDEKAASLSDAAWRLFVSSWLLADDHGGFRASPRYLAAAVWQDTTRIGDSERALTELVSVKLITVYTVNGESYGLIPTWGKHQRIDNAGKPRVPSPEDSDTCEPPRTSEDFGDSPRFAALPPTSDLRPPTNECNLGKPSDAEPVGPAIREVWAAYIGGWKKNNSAGRAPILDDRRKRLVKTRLKDFSTADLCLAASGIWRSEWHVQNRQTSFDLALRNSTQVERFIGEHGPKPPAAPTRSGFGRAPQFGFNEPDPVRVAEDQASTRKAILEAKAAQETASTMRYLARHARGERLEPPIAPDTKVLEEVPADDRVSSPRRAWRGEREPDADTLPLPIPGALRAAINGIGGAK